jgi:hypothetical protein
MPELKNGLSASIGIDRNTKSLSNSLFMAAVAISKKILIYLVI